MSSRYLPTEGVTVEELDDGLCLFRESDSELLVLNHTAADIWRLTDTTTDIGQLLEALASRYGVEVAELAADVERVLAELTDKGYLRPVYEPAD